MALDPRLRALLWVGEQLPETIYENLPPHEARRAFSDEMALLGRLAFGHGPHVHERVVMLDRIRAKTYRPSKPGRLPIILYFHGGGWVIGSPETHDSLCRRLAVEAKALVISVDYRLAPEHPFPAAIDDVYTSLKWAHAHATELDVDASRIAVCGDSAGGNLAACVAIRARDEGGPAICMQGLIFPAIEPNFETPSYLEFASGFSLTRSRMQFYWDMYAHDRASQDNAYAVPSRAKTLAGLPPAVVLTAECDVLRDEGEAYAEALSRAGNDVTRERAPGALHGYIMMQRLLPQARTSLALLSKKLREAFST